MCDVQERIRFQFGNCREREIEIWILAHGTRYLNHRQTDEYKRM